MAVLKYCLLLSGRFWASIEDVVLTRKSHNCAETAIVQGDSAGGSKLIEQTLMAVL